jgi:hypothetical protein
VSGSPSGSLLPAPSKATVAFAATVTSLPAAAVGAELVIVIETVAGVEDNALFLTVNENDSVPDAPGAVKVGFATDVELNATGVPAVCDHANIRVFPSESWLREPSSVTVARFATVCAVPASAMGGLGAGELDPPPQAASKTLKTTLAAN